MTTTRLDPSLVQALAGIAGLPPPAPEDAARIAAGAQGAIDAVRASGDADLFDTEPSEFLPALEALAPPPVRDP